MIRTLAIACLLLCLAIEARAQAPTATPQAFPACTRAELQAAADSYVAAQKGGDVSKIALAEHVTFLENMAAIDKSSGLWNRALPIALSRSFLDATRCKTFTEVIVTEGDHQYVVGTRLYVDRGKVTRIDSLVTDKGDWLFNANAYLKYAKAEASTCSRTSSSRWRGDGRARVSKVVRTPTAATSESQLASPQADDNGAIVRSANP